MSYALMFHHIDPPHGPLYAFAYDEDDAWDRALYVPYMKGHDPQTWEGMNVYGLPVPINASWSAAHLLGEVCQAVRLGATVVIRLSTSDTKAQQQLHEALEHSDLVAVI